MPRLAAALLALACFLVPLSGQAAPVLAQKEAKPLIKVLAAATDTAAPVKDAKPSANEITAVRWAQHVDAVTGQAKMRFVLDLTRPVTVESSVVGSPTPQLLVDINGAVPGNVAESYDFDGRIADQLTIASTGPAASRMILNLPLMVEESDYKVFQLPSDAANKKPPRLVIDVNQKVPPVEYTFTPGFKDKTIIIDPGHGGSDSGAVGLNKTQEKAITLAVAQRLKTLLENSGARVVMTRKDDRDVYGPSASAVDELKARVTVGNSNKDADVFVSIHIDAFTNRASGGTTTYFYQKTPYDALLARSIQSAIAPAGGLQDRGVKSANFYVIKRTVMPAVLAELAFISNPDEEKLLNTPDFQQKMAQGIHLGLDKFFSQAARLGGGR